MTRLQADKITLSYSGPDAVIHGLNVRIPDGKVTSIIGPNGCGKSTLLRALARLMSPREGTILLDGKAIQRQPTKEVAKRLCMLPQQPSVPESLTVGDLVSRGRYPHQALLQPPTNQDRSAVEWALQLAGMAELRDRPVDELSGGQRQRAWIAMALGQETSLLLLDEPTTYLDIAHQHEVLALAQRLNQQEGRTIVLVLHDINNAAQVSDHVIAMRDGAIVAEGAPEMILCPHLLEDVFGVSCDIVLHPKTNTPFSVPRGRLSLDCAPPYRQHLDVLQAEHLCAGYARNQVIDDASISIPPGKVTAIVGPNACGKSTLLRTFARLLDPSEGAVLLGGRPVSDGSHRAFARRLAILAQSGIAPAGVLVEDLVAVGRYPHQRWYRQWGPDDQQAVDRAMLATGVADLRWRPVDTLSGGQRQRVWLAMTLAQQTSVLLLDEPTTFLDIAHQVEVLDLVWELNRSDGRTIVLVLHDLGHACRYADFLVAMKDGRIVATGPPREIITTELVRQVFGVECHVLPDPLTGAPLIVAERTADVPSGDPLHQVLATTNNRVRHPQSMQTV